MPIVVEHDIDLPQPPHEVFAFLDDFKRVPTWLKRCEGVAKLGQGPNKAGDKLRYAYFEGGKHRIMDGIITTHQPGQQLSYRYYDKMMQAFIDFHLAPQGEGTRLTHRVELVPNSLLCKLLLPLFKAKLPRQTAEAMKDLKAILAQDDQGSSP